MTLAVLHAMKLARVTETVRTVRFTQTPLASRRFGSPISLLKLSLTFDGFLIPQYRPTVKTGDTGKPVDPRQAAFAATIHATKVCQQRESEQQNEQQNRAHAECTGKNCTHFPKPSSRFGIRC